MDYQAFVHSRLDSDPILNALMDIEKALTAAWASNPVTESPLGELCALAGAVRTFYEERSHKEL